jgi:hypothetical protein
VKAPGGLEGLAQVILAQGAVEDLELDVAQDLVGRG